MALPPQYQQKVVKIYALQYDGTNKQAVLDFAGPSGFAYETAEGVLMTNSVPRGRPIEVGEWVVQWSNTERRGTFSLLADASFGSTWQII